MAAAGNEASATHRSVAHPWRRGRQRAALVPQNAAAKRGRRKRSETIERPFEPSEYRDTYRDDLLALIERKAEGGEIAAPPEPVEQNEAEVVDIMSLLKKSLEDAQRKA